MIRYKFLYVYLIVAIAELLIDADILQIESLRYLTKPLLMIQLMLFVHDNLLGPTKRKLIYTLFFAFLGDVFLMFSQVVFFPLGLGAFLIMQVFYILIFFKKLSFHKFSFLDLTVLALVVAYILLFLNILWHGVGPDLKIPVVAYAIALGSMAFFAYLRRFYTGGRAYWMVFFGAIFFVISDSLLAYNKFVATITGNSFYVMGTYILAQLLLILGLVNFVIRNRFNIQ